MNLGKVGGKDKKPYGGLGIYGLTTVELNLNVVDSEKKFGSVLDRSAASDFEIVIVQYIISYLLRGNSQP